MKRICVVFLLVSACMAGFKDLLENQNVAFRMPHTYHSMTFTKRGHAWAFETVENVGFRYPQGKGEKFVLCDKSTKKCEVYGNYDDGTVEVNIKDLLNVPIGIVIPSKLEEITPSNCASAIEGDVENFEFCDHLFYACPEDKCEIYKTTMKAARYNNEDNGVVTKNVYFVYTNDWKAYAFFDGEMVRASIQSRRERHKYFFSDTYGISDPFAPKFGDFYFDSFEDSELVIPKLEDFTKDNIKVHFFRNGVKYTLMRKGKKSAMIRHTAGNTQTFIVDNDAAKVHLCESDLDENTEDYCREESIYGSGWTKDFHETFGWFFEAEDYTFATYTQEVYNNMWFDSHEEHGEIRGVDNSHLFVFGHNGIRYFYGGGNNHGFLTIENGVDDKEFEPDTYASGSSALVASIAAVVVAVAALFM